MLNLTRAWIVYCTAMCAAGWLLSLMHRLDAAGYVAISILLLAVAALWARSSFRVLPWAQRWRRILSRRRRFRRWLPRAFFVLAAVSLLGSLLNVPSHADALQYRTPRVLNWLADSQWHWIHAWDQRLNVISCGFEWLTAPIIALTRTDRWLGLINIISFLLLPGLIFGVLRQLGVRGRVAWNWMWIFPSGWVYCLQAGGLGNDQFAAVYGLAAVYFAMRARRSKQLTDLWLSLLACALVTGTKQTNVPLALLWFIAAWPVWHLCLRRPVVSIGVALLAIMASGAPMVCLDLDRTGYWTGWPPEKALQPASPLIGIAGNAFVITTYNLMPPVVPFSQRWNEARAHFLQTPLGRPFNSFEQFASVSRAMAEQTAAVGLFVCVLMLVTIVAAWRVRPAEPGPVVAGEGRTAAKWIRVASWGLLLLFMAKVGSWNAPRYLAAYYPFLLPTFLISSGHGRVVRARWWRWVSIVPVWLAVMLVVFSRQRPVWPARHFATFLQQQFPKATWPLKIRQAYEFPPAAWEPLDANLLSHLPPGEPIVGYATSLGGSDRQLWFPLGQRRVAYVREDDPPDRLRSLGAHFLLVDYGVLKDFNSKLETWMQRYDAELVATSSHDFGRDGNLAVMECYLLRLRVRGNSQPAGGAVAPPPAPK